MTRLEQIQEQFKEVYGTINLYIDGPQFFFIDVEHNRLESNHPSCSEYEQIDYDLGYELECLDEDGFQDLVEQLTKLKNQ